MFEDIKVGDDVVYVLDYGTRAVLVQVEEVSKQHVKVLGQKFRRKNGSMVGGDYGSPRITTANEHYLALVKETLAKKLVASIERKLEALALEDLKEVYALVDELYRKTDLADG